MVLDFFFSFYFTAWFTFGNIRPRQDKASREKTIEGMMGWKEECMREARTPSGM